MVGVGSENRYKRGNTGMGSAREGKKGIWKGNGGGGWDEICKEGKINIDRKIEATMKENR